MKYNFMQQKNYLMEENSANFFSDIDLMDEGTTYKILTLNRNTLFIEPV